jgi:hypothetical protein
MGFTIVQNIEILEGIELSNIYATISGWYQINKRDIFDNNHNKIDYQYIIIAGCNLYKNKTSYIQGKDALVNDINVNIENLNTNDISTEVHNKIYNALKNNIMEIYNNDNLTFIDE